jgi:NAD(P)-dependent dehydrogenase (short-subunit alcohol dehydrogenase family)
MPRATTPPDVLLTGACGGIGQALASRYLRAGSRVALLGRDEQVLGTLRGLAPDRARTYTPDVTDPAQMRDVAEDWTSAFGVPDVVIANAGVAGGFDTSAAEDLVVLRRMLEINLLGVATTFQPFVTAMRERRAGTLVGIASVAGWRGLPWNGAYSASKGGLIRYLESVRAELRPDGVRVLTVSPGYVRTPLTAGNAMRMPFLLEADEAAARIVDSVARGRQKVTVPRRAGLLSRGVSVLPVAVQDRLFLAQPRKPRVGEPGATEIPGL